MGNIKELISKKDWQAIFELIKSGQVSLEEVIVEVKNTNDAETIYRFVLASESLGQGVDLSAEDINALGQAIVETNNAKRSYWFLMLEGTFKTLKISLSVETINNLVSVICESKNAKIISDTLLYVDLSNENVKKLVKALVDTNDMGKICELYMQHVIINVDPIMILENILKQNNPKNMFLCARDTDISVENKTLLEKAIIATGSLKYMYLFAKEVVKGENLLVKPLNNDYWEWENSDDSKPIPNIMDDLINAAIATNVLEFMFLFVGMLELKKASVDLIERLVIPIYNIGDKKFISYCLSFIDTKLSEKIDKLLWEAVDTETYSMDWMIHSDSVYMQLERQLLESDDSILNPFDPDLENQKTKLIEIPQ